MVTMTFKKIGLKGDGFLLLLLLLLLLLSAPLASPTA